MFWVSLHDFIKQNYQKNSQIITIFPYYGKFPYFSLNCHILYFQMYLQYFSFLQKYMNNESKTGNILQFFK